VQTIFTQQGKFIQAMYGKKKIEWVTNST
jgi:hypothetical protein